MICSLASKLMCITSKLLPCSFCKLVISFILELDDTTKRNWLIKIMKRGFTAKTRSRMALTVATETHGIRVLIDFGFNRTGKVHWLFLTAHNIADSNIKANLDIDSSAIIFIDFIFGFQWSIWGSWEDHLNSGAACMSAFDFFAMSFPFRMNFTSSWIIYVLHTCATVLIFALLIRQLSKVALHNMKLMSSMSFTSSYELNTVLNQWSNRIFFFCIKLLLLGFFWLALHKLPTTNSLWRRTFGCLWCIHVACFVGWWYLKRCSFSVSFVKANYSVVEASQLVDL